MSFQNLAVFDKDADPEIDERQTSEGDLADDRTITSLNMDDSDKNVATMPLTGGNGVVVRSYTKSPHYLPLAFITLVLNVLFGLPAVVCACLSRKRRRRGDEEGATRMGKAAFWLSMVGIAVAIVAGIFTMVYIYVIIPNIIKLDLGAGGLT